mmetsp:Transcript_3849/g.12873  ORF Transcript_3849/g.12873 Transcript_3849/m.12873 type:complete len:495 (-) Transcript_3849:49-1533(-)
MVVVMRFITQTGRPRARHGSSGISSGQTASPPAPNGVGRAHARPRSCGQPDALQPARRWAVPGCGQRRAVSVWIPAVTCGARSAAPGPPSPAPQKRASGPASGREATPRSFRGQPAVAARRPGIPRAEAPRSRARHDPPCPGPMPSISIEEVEAGVGLLLLLLRLGLLGRSGAATAAATTAAATTTRRGHGRGSGKGLWVVDHLLDLLDLLEDVVGREAHGCHVLEGVHHDVRQRGRRRVVRAEGERGHIADARAHHSHEVRVRDVEHRRVVDGARLEHLADEEAVVEGLLAELVEQRGLRLPHAGVLLDHLHVLNDLDGALVDLGRDVERLEEGGLGRVQARGARLDPDVHGRKSPCASGGGHLVVVDHVADLAEVAVGHHKRNVGLELLHDGPQVGAVVVHVGDGPAHLGVLPVEHLAPLLPEAQLDVLHLLGPDVVHANDEHALILVEHGLELGEVLLLARAGRHDGGCGEGWGAARGWNGTRASGSSAPP